MKKRFSSADINQKHGNELSKKLYRTITDQSKRLDDVKSCARHIGDLFTPNILILRRKLCDYCERLIFSDPASYGRKGEELLWRKVFYDVVSTAKKFKKGNYTQDDISSLQNHINGGIGFYHHMISKIQTMYSINLGNVIDFPIYGIETEFNGASKDDVSLEWAELSLHQCLMYLGDLSRYKLEFSPNYDTIMATRYYMQAISFKPDYGMPHNQLGTLAMNQDQYLVAVYHYMRGLACKFSFDGTINNLVSLFEKNAKYIEQLPQQNDDMMLLPTRSEHVKRFLARFLLLIDIWYFNKNVPKVYNLCHLTFKDLSTCLAYSKPYSDSGDTPVEGDSLESESNTSSCLTNDMLFKIAVICLLCISKLQSKNSQQVSTVTAFTLAIYSQMIENITSHIQVSVLNYPLAENEYNSKKKLKHNNKIKLRRRKLNKNGSEDSESSDDDVSLSSSDESFISDEDDLLANSSEEEVEASELTNGKNTSEQKEDSNKIDQKENEKNIAEERDEILKKVKRMDVNDMVEIISEENLFQSIQILNDWLMIDSSILKSCRLNTPGLLKQITFMLNLINVNIKDKKLKGINLNLSNVEQQGEKIPLPEDIILRGLESFLSSQEKIVWGWNSKNTLSIKEEAIVRIMRLKAFGNYLTSVDDMGIKFEKKDKLFIFEAADQEKPENQSEMTSQECTNGPELPLVNGKVKDEVNPNNSKGGQLIKMKHMGQLWLASEVSALENRVRGKASLSPYLVLDADALIKYTSMVKHLVHSRKFIVLVPNAVVSALDDLKREKLEARDAIRWLETQFQRGNRFFRSQRPQERAPIPFIKYPKKKDKEMFTYIQIIECCYYLAEQQKGATNVVTLLIGNQNLLSNGENKEFSYVGLAQTAGIAIESITQFYSKSKKSSKENR